MSEMGDDFNALKQLKQQKRSDNRQQSAMHLEQQGVKFTSHNLGAHLIVENVSGPIDFWPGTGLWIARHGNKGRGVRNLVSFIKQGANHE